MAAFAWAALDDKGKETRGVLEADSARQVRQLLRDRGLAPLKIESAVKGGAKTATGKAAPEAKATASLFGGGPALKISELSLITRQLATLVQSSMPLEESLLAVSKQAQNSKVASIVMTVRSRVLEGHSLANSLGEFPRAFPQLYRATVAAGEHAGHLDLVLNRLADYSENAHASRQKAKLALIYPVMLFVMAVAIVSGLMAFVVPDVVEVFIGQGQELPPLTRGMIAMSNFVVNYGLLTLLLLAALYVAWRYALRNEGVQLQYHRRLLGMPLIGRLSRASETARYASTLSILTSSGVPLVEAMKIAAQVLANNWLKARVNEATQTVTEGTSLHQALERCGYFPPMMIHMIASGEMSGELDSMLARVAQTQQRELDDTISTLIGIFEPAMLLFMGVAVLLIVVAILQPIFNLNQLI